jgi:hypothetical protein
MSVVLDATLTYINQTGANLLEARPHLNLVSIQRLNTYLDFDAKRGLKSTEGYLVPYQDVSVPV